MSAPAEKVRAFFDRLRQLPSGTVVPEVEVGGRFLEHVQEVLKERDELLAALQELLRCAPPSPITIDGRDARRAAVDVIAKVQGP